MNMFQNTKRIQNFIQSHPRCPLCHRMADSIEFYERHMFQLSIIVHFHPNICKIAVRDPQTGGFHCPWQGCEHIGCDSLAMEGHILHCKFSVQ